MLNPTEAGTRENEARDAFQALQTPIRVLIVDDHAILRAGVREMLAEVQVVAEAGSAEDALQQLRDGLQVDVVVLDITLPGQSGIDLLKQLKRDQPELAILVLSMHPERSFAVRLMRAGANGYVPKMIVPEELVKAVRAVGTSRRWLRNCWHQSAQRTKKVRCTTGCRNASCRYLRESLAVCPRRSWQTNWG
jgi:DNA-binding NarL/FixJ family response regulator